MQRWLAVSLALFVTFLWSTSYILNKWAFAEGIGPLTLAGLRYGLAALTLGPVWLARRRGGAGGQGLPWRIYVGLGVAGYLVAQGCQYVGQFYLTPTQASMILSVGNTLQVLLIGLLWLREMPGRLQGVGMLLALGGVLLYYFPWRLGAASGLGIGMILLSGLGYAVHLTANRHLLGRHAASPLDLVLWPMAVGAVGMTALGLWLESWPVLSWKLAGLLLWLGPVNGAAAFLLWTESQRSLQAFESSTVNSSMLLQIALLDAWLLGRELSGRSLGALVAVGAGILLVQTARRRGEAHGAAFRHRLHR